jgi:hypothetical protein
MARLVMNWWARFVERWQNPWGRCSRHGCPLRSRSYSLSGYDSMEIEFCPQCEDEEATAKWANIHERSGTEGSDSPCVISAVRMPDLHNQQDRFWSQRDCLDKT